MPTTLTPIEPQPIDSRQGRAAPAIPEDRRRSIADLLLATGAVTVAQVEEQFGISAMTARRDLHELERRGLARRTHGGAVLPTLAGHEDSFDRRMKVDAAAKQRLARAAVDLLNPHETVFLDSSSTSHYVARRMIEVGIATTVLTNSLPVMTLLAAEAGPNVELIGVGGTLRALTRSFVGAGATRTVTEYYADRLFLSVKGVVNGERITDADPLEADVKRTMIEHARESVLLIDSSKLHARGLTAIASLSQIAIVLATDITPEQRELLERSNAEVRVLTGADAAGEAIQRQL